MDVPPLVVEEVMEEVLSGPIGHVQEHTVEPFVKNLRGHEGVRASAQCMADR